jgi:hypothetical protein
VQYYNGIPSDRSLERIYVHIERIQTSTFSDDSKDQEGQNGPPEFFWLILEQSFGAHFADVEVEVCSGGCS